MSLPANTPSVPPDLRQILHIPETPAPPPRRHVRPRFDGAGRRLPPGPPPPLSWVNGGGQQGSTATGKITQTSPFPKSLQPEINLPGIYVPEKGSLVDVVLRNMAMKWDIHRDIDYGYLNYVPSHLKPALIRLIGIANGSITAGDLRAILLPQDEEETSSSEDEELGVSNPGVTYLDLTNSIGDTLRLKDVFDLIQPPKETTSDGGVQESWDEAGYPQGPSRSLLPNLTHLSLALRSDPAQRPDISWRQLLHHADQLSSITHLSLAYWPAPCLTTGTKAMEVMSPAGRLAYGGTTIYSHSLDEDWNEALLVLRRFSKSLYQLEYLDLTGCGSWFPALKNTTGSDHVDWVGTWGKITRLRLRNGWILNNETLPSERFAYRRASRTAVDVERHIRLSRAGKGRIITVERDEIDE